MECLKTNTWEQNSIHVLDHPAAQVNTCTHTHIYIHITTTTDELYKIIIKEKTKQRKRNKSKGINDAMKATRNKNYRPLNSKLVVEQAVCKQGSVLPMTQGAQLRSGDSDDAQNFYITFLARSFVLRHMTVTSKEQGRRANDERRSCRSIVLEYPSFLIRYMYDISACNRQKYA